MANSSEPQTQQVREAIRGTGDLSNKTRQAAIRDAANGKTGSR